MNIHVDPAQAQSHALTLTRLIPAPPVEVFAAWTTPERIQAWWGPYGMTTSVGELDLRPGGRFITVMRDAAGKEHPGDFEVVEIAAPSRLVVRIAKKDGPLAGAQATVTFAAAPEGTRLTVCWDHVSVESRAAHEGMGFFPGWSQMLDRLSAHAMPVETGSCPFSTGLEPQHGWLHRLLGEWTYEAECSMGPDQPPMHSSGTERVHTLGGFWIIGEGEGQMPGGGMARTRLTLGYDARAKRFRGTWIGSMMAHLWVYDGALSEDALTLPLEAEGPAFSGQGLARYRDITEFRGDDHRVLMSQMQGEDGGWTTFMTAHYRRVG